MAEETTNGSVSVGNDPVAEMMENDRQRLTDQLQGQLGGGPNPRGQQSDAASTDTSASTAEQNANPNPSATPSQATEDGTDLQSVLANLPPNQHDSVRRMYADSTRNKQRISELEGQVNSFSSNVDEAVRRGIADAQNEEKAVTDPMSQVTPEQLHLFESLAAQLGFVKKEELNRDKAQSFTNDLNQEAVNRFGDDFGSYGSSGSFVLNEAQTPALASLYDRLEDPARGITYRDLYVLGNFDRLISAAEERGRNNRMQSNGQRTQQLVRAQTEGSPTTATQALNLRGEKGSSADSSRNVLARSMANAKRYLNI